PAGRPGKGPTSPTTAGALSSAGGRATEEEGYGNRMNMRKAVAAAFGAALLGAGTSAVVGGAAHGQLDANKTGTATSSQVGTGGFTGADADNSSATIDA